MNRVDFLATAVTAAALGAMILPMVTGPGAVIPLLVGILVVARIIALWAAWAAAWLQESIRMMTRPVATHLALTLIIAALVLLPAPIRHL